MRILVISDTHIPRVAEDLPDAVYSAIRSVDMVVHAGDFVDEDVLTNLRKLKRTYAVCGNMDSIELRRSLKPKEIIAIGKVRIGLIHGYGAPKDLINTVASEFSNVDAIIFGHSHRAVNTVRDGVLFFNPGSPTDTVFATTNSYGILDVGDNTIEGKIITI